MDLDAAVFRLTPGEATVGAWLLTYVVHATLLFVAVALVAGWRRVRSDALRETLWKFALLGGVITASVQLAVGGRMVGDAWTFAVGEEANPVVPADALPSPVARAAQDDQTPPVEEARAADFAPHLDAEELAALSPGTVLDSPPARSDVAMEGRGITLALFVVPALLGLLVLAWRWRRFQHTIAGRTPIAAGEAPLALARLRERSGLRRPIRLSRSDAITVPVAFGILRPEICVPERALRELGAASLESMLAHELAHHVRRDPLWLALWRVFEALLFVQPLNRWARRRWQELAEYRADAMAARFMGNGLPLARCLTEVATWMVEARRTRESALAPGMVERRSSLERRISRLCAARPVRADGNRTWHAIVGGTLLVAAAVVAPGFATGAPAPAPGEIGTPAAPAHGALPRLALPEALGALAGEIEALDAEMEALRRTLRAQGSDPALERLLEEIAVRSRGLLSRHLEIEEQGRVAPLPRKQEPNPESTPAGR